MFQKRSKLKNAAGVLFGVLVQSHVHGGTVGIAGKDVWGRVTFVVAYVAFAEESLTWDSWPSL